MLYIQQFKLKIMKRIVLSAILFAFVVSGYSQKHIRLSFAGGPSVNWMSATNLITEKGNPTLGYDFGLNGDFYFSDDERYALQSGVQITNVGGELTYLSTSGLEFSGIKLPANAKVKYNLRYVEIPLDIKLKTDQFGRVRYWGCIGLSSMLNISAKADSNDGLLKKTNINNEVKLFNLAMNVGAGFDFDLGGSNSLITGLVFQNGLLDVTSNKAINDKVIVNTLKLRIGVIF